MTTSTSTWLQSKDWVDAALVLLIEGLPYAFTNNEDLSGLSSAWNTATSGSWPTVSGGLSLSGSVERRIEIFNAQVRPSSLTFSILDVDDVLTPLMFGEASSDIERTDLGLSLDSSSVVVSYATHNPLLQPGVGDIYIGTETILVTADTNVFYVAGDRGFRSIGGTSTLDNHFGRPHEISSATGDTPEITNVPTAFYNRGVALFVCHRTHGTWSAGFPGSSSSDAELLWTGRIKSWDEDGEGTITIDCVEITERLQTSLMARQYTGKLSNGITPSSADTDMIVRCVGTLSDLAAQTVTVTDFIDGFANWAGAGEFLSIDEIVSAINEQLVKLFVTDTPGTYAPVGVSVFLSGLDSDGKFTFGVSWPTATDPGVGSISETVRVELYLRQNIWELLGFGEQMFATNGENRSVLNETNVFFPRDIARVVATNQPAGRIIKEDGTMEVNADSSLSSFIPFTPQTSVPAEINSNTTAVGGSVSGFLMIGDDILIAVEQLDTNTFKIKLGGVVGSVHGRNGVLDGDISPFFGSSANVQSLFLATATDLPVRQVWLETFPMGEMFLKLMVSTGTSGYNHPDHDYFPAWMGVGIPWTLIDTDSILGLNDSPYTLLVTKPVSFLKLFESAMNFAGKQLAFIDGKLTMLATTIGDNGDADLVLLTEANKATQISAAGQEVKDRTTCMRAPVGILNRVTLKYNATLSEEFKRTITVNAVTSQSDYDQVKSATVNGLGIYQGNKILADASLSAWETNTVASILAEFSKPVAVATRSYDFSLATKLFPGKRVSLSDNSLINPVTGSRGVTGILGWCLSANFDWMTGVGKAEIVFQPSRSSAISNSLGPSALNDPDVNTGGFANGYNSSTKQLTLLPDEFSVTGQDIENFIATDVVQVVELDPEDGADPQIIGPVVISSVDVPTNTVTFQTALTGYAGGVSPSVVSLLDDFAVVSTVATSKVTASVNLAANTLLLFVIEQGDQTAHSFEVAPVIITDSGPGLIWTTAETNGSGTWNTTVYKAYNTGAATGVTFTLTWAQTIRIMKYGLFQVTEVNSSTPIRQTTTLDATATLSGTHFEFDFALPGKTQNMVIGIQSSFNGNNYTGAPVAITGWTTIGTDILPSFVGSGFQFEWHQDFAETIPFTWNANQGPTIFYGIGLEIGSLISDNKSYVMEYASISSSTATQRTKAAYLADATTRSTGLAAKDAFVWGGDVPNVSSTFDPTKAYQRANLFNDDVGSALSVHKLSTLNDWANTAFCYHLAPIYTNELFPGGITTTSTDFVTVWGPIWVPIYHIKRRLEFKVLATAPSGSSTGTFRFVSSRRLPIGTGFSNPTYIDVDDSSEDANWVSVDGSFTTGTNAYVTGTIASPSTTIRNLQRGTYLSLDVQTDAPGVKLYSMFAGQVLETLS